MIAEQRLPITLAENRRDGETLTAHEDVVLRDIREGYRALADAKADLDLARKREWGKADGRTRDERHAQVEVAVADEKKRVLDMEGRVAATKAFSHILGHRSMRLNVDARFSMRQMELDTPGPDRAPHWERTTA